MVGSSSVYMVGSSSAFWLWHKRLHFVTPRHHGEIEDLGAFFH
jgi:hypothetical protein